MRILRTAMLAIALTSMAAACGGKDKGAAEPAADPAAEAAPAEGETPAADPAAENPCAGGENPCGGATPE
jgi:hypothetical protein